MKRIAITTPDFWPGEAEAVVNLLKSGFWRVHIRKPNATRAEVEALIVAIPALYYDAISLHDYLDLAVKYRLGGVHLNKRYPNKPAEFEGVVSQSCHSFDELLVHADRDYCFLSPIFGSISKQGYSARFSLKELCEAGEAGVINDRVFALGGITNDNANVCLSLGFGGVAMLGYAWDLFKK